MSEGLAPFAAFAGTVALAGLLVPHRPLAAYWATMLAIALYAAAFVPRTARGAGLVGAHLLALYAASAVQAPPVLVLALVPSLFALTATVRSAPFSLALAAVVLAFGAVDAGLLWTWDDATGRSVTAAASVFLSDRDPVTLLGLLGLWPLVVVFGAVRVSLLRGVRLWWASLVLHLGLYLVCTALALTSRTPWPFALLALYWSLAPLKVPRTVTGDRAGRWLGVTAAAAASVVLASWARLEPEQGPLKIAVVPSGLGTWAPERGQVEEAVMAIEANFGEFAALLGSVGHEVVRLGDDWSDHDVRDADVVIAINPARAPNGAQARALDHRVRAGATLLVAGDHTDMTGVGTACNGFLRTASIRLRTDSAVPSARAKGWTEALWIRPDLRRFARDNRSAAVSVGASLRLGRGAEPLIVGVSGFLDAPNLEEPPGNLGNLTYERGEPRDGIVLAARQGIGEGQVVVLGDTSPFQDGALTESHEFARALVASRKRSESLPLSVGSLSIILLAALMMVMRLRSIVLALACLALAALAVVSRPAPPSGHVRPSVAILDEVGSLYPQERDEEDWYKFLWVLQRAKGQPLRVSADALGNGGVPVVVVAPAHDLAAGVTDKLLAHIEKGGTLALFVDAASAERCAALLEAVGVSVADEPLGGKDSVRLLDTALASAVAVGSVREDGTVVNVFYDAYEVAGLDDVWASVMGRPIAGEKRYGRGRVVVFGDSRWVLDGNLGIARSVNLGATRVLYAVAEKL